MKYIKCFVLILLLSLALFGCSKDEHGSVRKERKAIVAGNKLYEIKDFKGAIEKYSSALKENVNSPEAMFNLGVAQLAYSAVLEAAGDTTASHYAADGESSLSLVASARGRAVPLAAMACYNLANRNFRGDKLDEAIALYIQSLRLMPGFPQAVRNLRIAQLKKEQNEDNQDQNEDKQDRQNQNNNDQNSDQNKNREQQNQNQQDQQNQQEQQMITPKAAEGILQSVENNENSARARMRNMEERRRGENNVIRKRW